MCTWRCFLAGDSSLVGPVRQHPVCDAREPHSRKLHLIWSPPLCPTRLWRPLLLCWVQHATMCDSCSLLAVMGNSRVTGLWRPLRAVMGKSRVTGLWRPLRAVMGKSRWLRLNQHININLVAYCRCILHMFLPVSRKTRGQINDEKTDLGLILHLFPLHNNIYISTSCLNCWWQQNKSDIHVKVVFNKTVQKWSTMGKYCSSTYIFIPKARDMNAVTDSPLISSCTIRKAF